MQKLCPVCNTLNNAIGFDLSDRELHTLHQLNLSEHLCKTCYHKELSTLRDATKAELIPLNKKREITQTAYYEATKAWKEKADLFRLIDYNVALIKFNTQKKTASSAKKVSHSEEPPDIELLARQILANLSQEQQEAIIRTFQANSNLQQQSL